jgi:hypothetical protein
MYMALCFKIRAQLGARQFTNTFSVLPYPGTNIATVHSIQRVLALLIYEYTELGNQDSRESEGSNPGAELRIRTAVSI